MKKLLLFLAVFLCAGVAKAQNPQPTDLPPTPPVFDVNAKYTNGTAPGYWPTAGSGLTLNISAGTAYCSGTIVTYAGNTLTMTDNTTNYVYLNTASSCVPATSTSSSVFSSNFPIAVVATASGAITSITDDRTMFTGNPGSLGGSVLNCSAQYSFAEYLTAGTSVGCGPTPPTINGVYLCGYSVTGSAALAPTCPLLSLLPRGVTGTTDTVLYSDDGSLIDYHGTAAVAVTLPTATTLGNGGFWTVISNNTSGPGGNVTVTPTTWTINGASTLVAATGQECRISTDPASATNWLAHCSASGSPTGAAGGDLSGTYPNPTVADVGGTAAATIKTRSFGTTFGDTGGSALTSGSVVYFTVPYACTISAWNITVDAGTVTFDIWKIATGTAIPTAANSITASAKPALSTGTALHSTTLSGWTTSVSANDIFGIQLNTVATAKYAELDIQCGQ